MRASLEIWSSWALGENENKVAVNDSSKDLLLCEDAGLIINQITQMHFLDSYA